MDIKEVSIKGKDNYVFTIMYNITAVPIKGVVIVSHGFGEHARSYIEFAEYLASANYACIAFDQRGHGKLSEQSYKKRKKSLGIISSYQNFMDDIESVKDVVQKELPNTPIVLYGHSMGGNIAINYLLRQSQSDFSCAILESPWLGLYKEFNSIVYGIIKLLGCMSPQIAVVNKLLLSDITSDNTKAEEIGSDPLYHNRISMKMLSGIKDGCTHALNSASQLYIPTYLAFAKNERIVSNQAIQKLSRECAPNVTIKEYDSHHSIHNDVQRETFYQDIIAFLDVYCPAVQLAENAPLVP